MSSKEQGQYSNPGKLLEHPTLSIQFYSPDNSIFYTKLYPNISQGLFKTT